jgi:hypothetical protein
MKIMLPPFKMLHLFRLNTHDRTNASLTVTIRVYPRGQILKLSAKTSSRTKEEKANNQDTGRPVSSI